MFAVPAASRMAWSLLIFGLVPFRILATMPSPDEDQPEYPAWREAAERVIAALLDSTKEGTPERAAAEREHQAAYRVYMLIANGANGA
jgi:hypothetical protein